MSGLAKITTPEWVRLKELEQTIDAGKQTFVDVGLALAEIREKRLYRGDYATFEDYCHERWGWNRAYASKLIVASDAVQSLPENVSHGIQNERQARELARIPKEDREAVLAEVAQHGPVTAHKLRQAARRRARALPVETEPEPPAPATPADKGVEALGGLKAVRVLKAFDTWVCENLPDPEDRRWALVIMRDHINDLLNAAPGKTAE